MIRELRLEFDALGLEKHRVEVEYDRVLLELKQHKLDSRQAPSQRREAQLKDDIKLLVGKLMKAKDKLSEDEARNYSRLSSPRRFGLRSPKKLLFNESPFS